MANNKKLECLLNFHDWYIAGCVRQCNRCHMVAIYDASKSAYVNIGIQSEFDLKSSDRIQNTIKQMQDLADAASRAAEQASGYGKALDEFKGWKSMPPDDIWEKKYDEFKGKTTRMLVRSPQVRSK